MRIAILGSNSQIAKDLIELIASQTDFECTLFARNTAEVQKWLIQVKIQNDFIVKEYVGFKESDHYDIIINFVGVGDPSKAKEMGSAIFDVTLNYDRLVLDYLEHNPDTKYIFLSSGAVYGGNFVEPASKESDAIIPINQLTPADWYAVAKLYAEARHRSLTDYSIIDVRVFNYFSHTQDVNARFFITDLVRALKNNEVLITSADNIVRDFLVPSEFFKLVRALIEYIPVNIAVDCYTKSPVEKFTLLTEIEKKYGLKYKVSYERENIDATGQKMNYYSLNKMPDDIGYEPGKTSLEGVLCEITKMIESA